MSDTSISGMKPTCPWCNHFEDTWSRMKIHVKHCAYAPHQRRKRFQTSLGCAFCGDTSSTSFEELSLHVRTQCAGQKPVIQAGGFDMNVGKYVEGQQTNFLPLLDPKLFKKLAKKGKVVGKMLACREVNSRKTDFHGLAMDFKSGETEFSFLARFDRFDIPALAKQGKSEDTDDWIGQNFEFIARKSSKGQTFVNVEFIKEKK